MLNAVDYRQMRTGRNGISGQNRWWPILSVAPSGEVFHYWDATDNHFISTDQAGAMRPANAVVDQDAPPGVAIQYDEGRLIMSGGNQGSWRIHGDNNRALTIDLNGPAPVVQQTGAMRAGRTYHNLVPLPNGEVIALGGSTNSGSFNNRGAVYQAEIWNPQTGQWRLVAAASVPRNYHSTALLLTDGRVFSGGGGYQASNEFADGASHQNAEIYSPPYLFDANGAPAARPQITSAPGVIRPGETFSVQGSGSITRFSMVRMGATTHAVNTDSRFVWVPGTSTGVGRYALTTTANGNVLLPGYWMLFGLDSNDVPSVAHVVRVDRPISVTTPGDVQYVRLIAKSEVNGNPWTTVAELNLLDGAGDPIDRTTWQVTADSEETGNNGDGLVTRAIDGDPGTLWHTDWRTNSGTANDPPHDHVMTVDLGAGYTLTALEYLPRQDMANGRIRDYEVEVSADGQTWTQAAQGQFPDGTGVQVVSLNGDTSQVTIAQSPPSAAGQSVSFTASNGGPGLEYRYSWGDGEETGFQSEPNASHVYSAPGRYVVVVTVRNPVNGQSTTYNVVHLVHDPAIDFARPERWLSSTRIAFHPTRNQVWNVNPDNDTVTVIDSSTYGKLAEIPVEAQPSSVAFDDAGQAWITNKTSGTVSVIDAASLTVARTVLMPNTNARPHGILVPPGANRALVALEGTGEVASVDVQTYAVTTVVDVVLNARHLARSPSGSTAVVTSFITPPVVGEHTATPDISAGTDAVATVDFSTMQVGTRFAMRHSSDAPEIRVGTHIETHGETPLR